MSAIYFQCMEKSSLDVVLNNSLHFCVNYPFISVFGTEVDLDA